MSSAQVILEPVILNAGKSSNVIPADAELWYSYRTLLKREEHIETAERIIVEAKKAALRAGAELEANPFYGTPLLINSPDVYQHVKEIINSNGQKAVEILPMFGG